MLFRSKESQDENTEGKGTARIISMTDDIVADVEDVIPYPIYRIINLSENILPFFDIPIPISFSIIAQTQLKLTRL